MGQIDLSDAGASSGNVFNNTSNHSWHFTGTSQLGNGLADVHNNTGTIYTTDPNDPSNNDITELAGVETFNNGSSIKSGTINLQDGFTGDVFTLSPTSGGTLAFNGEAGNSFLKVDSFLGTPSDSSSDTLVINGNVTGSTGIQVNNVNAGFGGYNPTGIDVVNATGSLSPENFFLAGGPIDTGLFNYNLYLNGANEWVLASSPNQTFFELPSLTSAAQSMWHNAAGIWLDRTADLRASRRIWMRRRSGRGLRYGLRCATEIGGLGKGSRHDGSLARPSIRPHSSIRRRITPSITGRVEPASWVAMISRDRRMMAKPSGWPASWVAICNSNVDFKNSATARISRAAWSAVI